MSGDPGYTEADLDAVSDIPEWTEDDFAQARPFQVLFPAFAGTLRNLTSWRRGARTMSRSRSTETS